MGKDFKIRIGIALLALLVYMVIRLKSVALIIFLGGLFTLIVYRRKIEKDIKIQLGILLLSLAVYYVLGLWTVALIIFLVGSAVLIACSEKRPYIKGAVAGLLYATIIPYIFLALLLYGGVPEPPTILEIILFLPNITLEILYSISNAKDPTIYIVNVILWVSIGAILELFNEKLRQPSRPS